jgi:hypothetical protein
MGLIACWESTRRVYLAGQGLDIGLSKATFLHQGACAGDEDLETHLWPPGLRFCLGRGGQPQAIDPSRTHAPQARDLPGQPDLGSKAYLERL